MKRKTIKQSVTLTQDHHNFLKELSFRSDKFQGKVSTGIEIACNILKSNPNLLSNINDLQQSFKEFEKKFKIVKKSVDICLK